MGGRSSSFGKHAGGVTGLGVLPELQGSEKQVKWAGEIRDNYKEKFQFFKDHYLDEPYDPRKAFQEKSGRYPSRRRKDPEFQAFRNSVEVKAKTKAGTELAGKQGTSQEFMKTLAYKGYKGNADAGIKEQFDFKTKKEYRDYLVKGAKKAFNEKSASWWIDHRPK